MVADADDSSRRELLGLFSDVLGAHDVPTSPDALRDASLEIPPSLPSYRAAGDDAPSSAATHHRHVVLLCVVGALVLLVCVLVCVLLTREGASTKEEDADDDGERRDRRATKGRARRSRRASARDDDDTDDDVDDEIARISDRIVRSTERPVAMPKRTPPAHRGAQQMSRMPPADLAPMRSEGDGGDGRATPSSSRAGDDDDDPLFQALR